MEEVLAAFAGQARKSKGSQHTQAFDRPPKYTPLNKNFIRKKSVFKLAAEFFKPNKYEKAEVPTLEHEKQERTRVPWNTFVSLRGFRESKERTSIFGTARCRSSSQQKSNELAIDEFSVQKAMRRKSLQDLLGTVGNKLSLTRRLVYSEDSTPQIEAPLEAMAEYQDISPLVLPEPALTFPGPPNAVLSSLCHYSQDSRPNEVLGSHSNLGTGRHSGEALSGRPKLRTKPSLRTINVAAQPTNTNDRPGSSETHRESQELKKKSPPPSAERFCPVVPADYLRGVSPQVPTRVRFVDRTDPPQYRYSADFEDIIAPENANLDPSFLRRALSREGRYNSIHGGPSSEQTESSTKGLEKHVALTAAKMSKNMHLSNNDSKWSVDSSETDTDDMSDYNWVEKEVEVQDIIYRGKEIMTLGTLSPYLHSSSLGKLHSLGSSTDPVKRKGVNIAASPGTHLDENPSPLRNGAFSPHYDSQAYVQGCPTSREHWVSSASYVMLPVALEEPQPELPSSGDLTLAYDGFQETDEVTAQTFSGKVSRGGGRMISLENGERFRSRRMNSRMISGEPVHIVYPPSEFRAAHTKTYMSKSSAFGDLYQNHSGFSDYCLFDPGTRTYYPQVLSDPVSELLQSNDEKLEVLWLPLEMFPADSSNGQADTVVDCLNLANNCVSEVDGSSSYKAVDMPNLDSGSLKASDGMNSKTPAFYKGNSTASSHSHHDSAYSEHDAWVGYTDSAPHIDMVGTSSSNYTMTLISTREVSSSTTGSLKSEYPQPDGDDMDDSYKIAVDSATVRLYLGSLSSSTESLLSIAEVGVTGSKSADSILCKLKDAQPEDPKHVKTWIEMEHDFLDKFAPRSQILPNRRRRVAVYEAFKKLKGLAGSSDDDTLNSCGSDSGFQDAPDTEHEKWLRYREAYMDFSFEHMEDIAECGPIDEESSVNANSSRVGEIAHHNLGADPSIITDAKDKNHENMMVLRSVHAPLLEMATFRNHFGDTPVEQQALFPQLPTAEGKSNSHIFGVGRTDVGRESNVLSLGGHSRLASEAYSDTDSTTITMLSGYMFTHYAEQLGECTAESHGEEQQHCKDERDDQSILSAVSDHAMDIAPNISVFENASILLQTEPLEIDTRVGSDTDQLSIWSKIENIGLARAVTVQLCPPPTQVGLAPLPPRHSMSSNVGCFNSAETFHDPTPSVSRLAMRKRVLTPKMRVSSPLAEFASQNNQTIRCTSPSPSDADTEVSENFGQKLNRFKHIEEEEKENDFWWTDAISYG